MRRSGIGFLNHPLDLFQLFHQVNLRGQAPGSVHQHHVFLARLAGTHRVKAHCSRVTAFLADDFHRVAVSPDGELLARCGAKGVSRSKQHAGTAVGQVLGELTDAGGLACTVDTGHHDHGGHVLAYDQWLLQRLQQLGQRRNQRILQRYRMGDAAGLGALAQVFDECFGGLHASVGHEQRVFQALVQRFVHLAAAEYAGDAVGGFAQTGFELVQPFLPLGRYGRGQGNFNGGGNGAADHRAAWQGARQWRGRSGGCCNRRYRSS